VGLGLGRHEAYSARFRAGGADGHQRAASWVWWHVESRLGSVVADRGASARSPGNHAALAVDNLHLLDERARSGSRARSNEDRAC